MVNPFRSKSKICGLASCSECKAPIPRLRVRDATRKTQQSYATAFFQTYIAPGVMSLTQ
jgi:hypothetical protein